MEPDSILKQVHAMKAEFAREANFDLHALWERLGEIEAACKDLLVDPAADSGSARVK